MSKTPNLSGLALLLGNQVVGGTVVTGEATISGPAGHNGQQVTFNLDPKNTGTKIPTLTIPAGATSATFSVTFNTVTKNTTSTIWANSGNNGGVTLSYPVTVTPAAIPVPPTPVTLSSLSVNLATVPSAGSVTIAAHLTAAAPSGGAVVTLSASPNISGLSTVSVPAGATSASVTVSVPAETANTNFTVTGVYGTTANIAFVVTAAVVPPPPPPPPPVINPPAISITAPVAGATVSGTIIASATASDANTTISSVQWQLDGPNGTNLGTDTTSPYTETINTAPLANGVHTLTAIATNAQGQTTTSTGVAITVANAVPVPPVLTTITLSPSSVSLQVGQTTTFTAQGFDQNGKTFAITPTFSASGNGTFNGAVFTATAAGTATIHASANGVTSNAASATITAVVNQGSLASTLGTPSFADSFNYKTSGDAAFTKNWVPQIYTANNYAGAGSNVSMVAANITFPVDPNLGVPCLCLTLNQPSAAASTGGEILSAASLFASTGLGGYGTYEFLVRFGSTSATPTGSGSAVSGSVSSTFMLSQNNGGNTGYVEIDTPECEGQHPTWAEYDTWFNSDSGGNTQPTGGNFVSQGAGSDSYLDVPTLVTGFNYFGFVWSASRIDYYLNGVLQGSLTKGVPQAQTAAGNIPGIDINHYGCNSKNWGGTATPGATRYCYVQSAKFWKA